MDKVPLGDERSKIDLKCLCLHGKFSSLLESELVLLDLGELFDAGIIDGLDCILVLIDGGPALLDGTLRLDDLLAGFDRGDLAPLGDCLIESLSLSLLSSCGVLAKDTSKHPSGSLSLHRSVVLVVNLACHLLDVRSCGLLEKLVVDILLDVGF